MLILFAVCCGCRSTAQLKEPVDPTEGTIEIRLSPPRTLDVRRPNGMRTSLEAVTVIRGQPLSVRGDSVTLRVDSWEGGNPFGDHAQSGETVLSTSDPGVTFFRERLSVTKMLLTAAIVVGLVALAIGQAAVA
jgi:hypothetical protein